MFEKPFRCASLALVIPVVVSPAIHAQTCYEVGGSVTTVNLSETTQEGNIELQLSWDGATYFHQTGELVGTIVGSDGMGVTKLTHHAKFPGGMQFTTQDDSAVVTGVRKFLADGVTPCSFYVTENINRFIKANRVFKDTTLVDITATGHVANCPDENSNAFILSGTLCTAD